MIWTVEAYLNPTLFDNKAFLQMIRNSFAGSMKVRSHPMAVFFMTQGKNLQGFFTIGQRYGTLGKSFNPEPNQYFFIIKLFQ